MKPAATSPAAPTAIASSKSGTTIVKGAPPKETARITVKPNLPPTAVRAGNFPTARPGAVPVAVGAGGAVAKAVAKPIPGKPSPHAAGPKPATTIVKTAATPKVAAATVKPAVGGPPVPAMPTQFQEEASHTLTTALAGVMAVLTWGTAGVLLASLMSWI